LLSSAKLLNFQQLPDAQPKPGILSYFPHPVYLSCPTNPFNVSLKPEWQNCWVQGVIPPGCTGLS